MPQAISHQALPRIAALGCIFSRLLPLGAALHAERSLPQLTASWCLYAVIRQGGNPSQLLHAIRAEAGQRLTTPHVSHLLEYFSHPSDGAIAH